MTTKWYETQAVEEWIGNEVNGENFKQVQKVLEDELMMNLAACCTAAYEGYPRGKEFIERVSQITSSIDESQDAAMFLVYHQALDMAEAQKLLQKQHLNNHHFKKINAKKERIMNEQQQADKPLTEKQVEFAQHNKQRVLQDVEEFKQFLQKQDNPQWWLKRRFFSFAANSFNKHKRDSFQAQQQQSTMGNKPSISDKIPVSNNQSSGQKI